MPRGHWAPVLDPIIEAMRNFDFNGLQLDVEKMSRFRAKVH